MALGLNAPSKIILNTSGTLRQLSTITPMERMMYSSAMKGTSFSVTCPMRLMPPSSTTATSRAMMMPIIHFITITWSGSIRLKLVRAVSMEETMVLT